MSATIAQPSRRTWRIWPVFVGLAVFALLLLVWLWNWDWFIPIVESRASVALGRRVTITHLHVTLGRQTTIAADDVVVANPDGFPQSVPLAAIGRLTIVADVMNYVHHRTILLPLIGVDGARIAATALENGQNNFTIKPPQSNTANQKPSAPPQIGDLAITDSQAHVVDPRFKSNFILDISTLKPTDKTPASIVVGARGTYGGQPITGRFVGGALLTLRDAAHPYPIDLHLANGQTRVSMVGTVENPLNFAGARVKLSFSGPDMSELYPLTGIPIPKTPPFSIVSNVDYQKPRIRLTNLEGRVGSSDLEGSISEDPGASGKPDVIMDLSSRRVDLTDLGGFIGTPAGKPTTPGETAEQEKALAEAKAKKTLLPDAPIYLPKLNVANIHLKYRGEHIENKFTPFDKLLATMDLVDGRITLHPLEFTVAQGGIISNIDLVPQPDKVLHADANIRFQRLDLSRLLQATHTFHGKGIIGGEAKIVTNGNSLATMMGHGDGEVKLALISGGNLSALLVDIAGLEFGNALLSALGVPNRADIQCFVTDLPLRHGIMDLNVFLLDTTEGRITGKGNIDFTDQMLNLSLTTRSKGFSIGSLSGPINITGPLGSPSIRPGAEIMARAGAAAGLGVLLTPLGALLPTIQFGVGDNNACTHAEDVERQPLALPSRTVTRRHRRRE
jgi:AsmA family protein